MIVSSSNRLPKLFVLDTNVDPARRRLHLATLKRTTSSFRSPCWRSWTSSRRDTRTSTSRPASSSATSTRSPATCCRPRAAPFGPGPGLDPRGLGRRARPAAPRRLSHDTPDHRILNTALRLNTRSARAARDRGLQRHQPADEGEVVGAARAGLHQRQGRELRQALYRPSASWKTSPASRSTPFTPATATCPWRCCPRSSTGGQRELHLAQRVEVGAGDLPRRRPDVRAGRKSTRPTASSPATRSNRSP